jgi:preprotein translocase subunit SecG
MRHFLLIFLLVSIPLCVWRFLQKDDKKQIAKALKKYAKPICFVFAITFIAMAIAIHIQAEAVAKQGGAEYVQL